MLRMIEAWTSASGLSLVVFPELGRRARLPAGRRLADLDTQELDALAEAASPLTTTERLIELDGGPWLVQQTGPAWAEPDEASADLCGILFTRLGGSRERHAVGGRPPAPLPDETALRRMLERRLAAEGAGEDSDEAVDESVDEDAD